MLLGCAMLSGFVGYLDSVPPIDSAVVSFSGSEKSVAVEVSTGDFESLWVEVENVGGGFMIYEGPDRPSIYIDNDEYNTEQNSIYQALVNRCKAAG
ncbi:hypothetical protein [Halorubrum sp. GN11GM_10-3_MGM]|uniref:hypothetical protein n=1 Tax=Halorubrum sp. GN11GM_10-3_MGM TaxID=2518111 RepID=UPI0010F4DCBA|nr:hypothetical protein [Halorubrum sp. GN11GM_10-3_MGM]TKX67634.1 hypothetical protein EXE40_14625 [Halorubrum sp. GN11GM_10-3_MGM]